MELDDVDEAAVIGTPDEALGERVIAVVRLRPGATVDEAGLRRHVADRLARFKVPDRIYLTPGPLPRNAAGKVLKWLLREQLQEVKDAGLPAV